MYYAEIQLCEGGSIRNLQVLLLFEVLDFMKFDMYMSYRSFVPVKPIKNSAHCNT